MKKFSRKKKKGGGGWKTGPNDRRGIKVKNINRFRFDVEYSNKHNSELSDYSKNELIRLEREARKLKELPIEKQFFLFSDEEIKRTKDEIQNCLESDHSDFNQYISDIDWFSKNTSHVSERVRRKTLQLLHELCPAKGNDRIEKQKREQEENIEKCTDNLVTKNSSITHQNAINLCSILNGILNTQVERDIPEKFDNILHEWFYDNSIIEEIFKTIRSDELCFLHEIYYDLDDSVFRILKHEGRNLYKRITSLYKFITRYLDPIKYYNNQIKPCNSKLIAIPLGIYSSKEPHGHSTILIIDRTGEKDKDGKERIIIEHFDSSLFSNKYDDFEGKVQQLITEMFGNDLYTYEFIGQMSVCPYNIQGRLRGTQYSHTCTQFQLWYAFKRLLEPEKPRQQVIDEMDSFLDNGVDGMIELIKTFQSVVKINLFDSYDKNFTGTVNDRNFGNSYQTAGNNKRTKRRKTKKIRI